MACTIHGTGSNNGTQNVTVTLTDSVHDRLVAVLSGDTNQTITVPASGSWSLLNRQDLAGPDGQTIAIYECLDSPGTGSYTWTYGNSFDYSVCMTSVSGGDNVTAATVSTAATNTSANTSPITVTASNAVTTPTNDSAVIHAWGLDTTAKTTTTAVTPPTGFSNSVFEATVSNWGSCGMSSKIQASAGTTGSTSSTVTVGATAGYAAWNIAIPASGPPGPYTEVAPTVSGNTAGNASGTANVTTFDASIGSPTAGERVILAIVKDGNASFTVEPSGWVKLDAHAVSTNIYVGLYYRDCDGTEGATVNFQCAAGEAFAAKSWRIQAGTFDTEKAPEFSLNDVTTATANNDPAAVTPTWGSQPDLFLCWVGVDANSTITGSPTNYSTIASVRSTNTTTGDRVACGYCSRSATTASEDPSAFTNSAQRSCAYVIAIAPKNPYFELLRAQRNTLLRM